MMGERRRFRRSFLNRNCVPHSLLLNRDDNIFVFRPLVVKGIKDSAHMRPVPGSVTRGLRNQPIHLDEFLVSAGYRSNVRRMPGGKSPGESPGTGRGAGASEFGTRASVACLGAPLPFRWRSAQAMRTWCEEICRVLSANA